MKKLKFINVLPIYINSKNSIKIYSTCIYNIKDNSNKSLNIGNKKIPLTFIFKKSIKILFTDYYLNFYKTILNINELKSLPIQNEVTIVSKNKNKYSFIYNIIYTPAFPLKL